ncbi:Nicotinamide-nucleotide amidohydrolase PncC [bioreactor metagenome]|uniref:Nicotinamide-nucleotide amidohydrolase PncC n=1 Tax=bioreactor metagenome TaxID=1076179 RepID=A0A645HQQ9_9ZZZZ
MYSINDEPLEVVVADMLKTQNKTIALAESCTGGMITSQLVSVPGISSNLVAGLVTYSNESKIKQLGVKSATLEKFGAVSDETAREMAEGLYKVTGADIALSVTGIAGPDGGSEEKPKGLVYIALKHQDSIESFQLKLTGNRQRIRTLATLNALDIIRKYLKKVGT